MPLFSFLVWIIRNIRRSKLILLLLMFFILWICLKQVGFLQKPEEIMAIVPESEYNIAQEYDTPSIVPERIKQEIATLSPYASLLSKNLKVHYKILKNRNIDHLGVITLTNDGTEPIKLKDMKIYFDSVRELKTLSSKDINLSHVNGLLHKIEPVSNSSQIAPGQSITLEFSGHYYLASRSLILPDWYFVAPNGEVGLINNTVGEQLSFVADFKMPDQWKTFQWEEFSPYTPEKRFEIIGFDTPKIEETALVVPQPMYVFDLKRDRKIRIDGDWGIYAEKGLEKEAKILKDFFQIKSELKAVDKDERPKSIVLKSGDPGIENEKGSVISTEAYVVMVHSGDQYIEVTGQTPAAVFYGIQTLLALVDEQGDVPMVTIKDAPRFEYRGMHLDVSRNFHPKTSIFRLLEVMAMYKLNKFHFHLTDDEAWRLEIPGLPELTTIGSKSCHDPTGLKCIQPQMGGDPRGTTSPTYYSVQDYQDILQFASDRHIEVIPEIDMPGHCHAAIKSMEARYQILMASGNKEEAEEFLLTEFKDDTQYESIQNYKDNTLNPCLESTYRFMTHVIRALVRMHKDIQPLKTYHFGGDEVPREVWKDSPSCDKFQPGVTYEEKRQKIKKYFIERTIKLVESQSLTVAGWDDFFAEEKITNDLEFKIVHSLDKEKKAEKDIIVYSWNDVNRVRGIKKAYLLAQEGYKVVLAHASHLYFDHPYEPDPEEPGNFWATRFSDTRKVFEYVPNLCLKEGFCEDSGKNHNILGITGALWSETVRTSERLEFMIFPRLLALAERAWHKSPWEEDAKKMNKQKTEEWKKFSSFVVNHELKRLEQLGIRYRLPTPGARFDENTIKVRTSLPGLPVQFSKDGGKTWHDITADTQADTDSVTLVTRSLDRQRMSRPVEIRRR